MKKIERPIETILVPLDFSDQSRQGAQFAFRLARQTNAKTILLTVLDVGDLRVAVKSGLAGFETSRDVQRRVRAWVESQFQTIDAPSDVQTERVIRRGISEIEILEAISRYGVDLVVMGSAGLARRIPIGSKTDFIIRNSDVPLVVIRARRTARGKSKRVSR